MASSGPLTLHEETDETIVDVVFVHGLRGDRLGTWTKDGVCWPRDLLPQDLPNARILSWGYDSTIAKVKSFSSQSSIFGHAQNLLSDLARVRKGAERVLPTDLSLKHAHKITATTTSHNCWPQPWWLDSERGGSPFDIGNLGTNAKISSTHIGFDTILRILSQ